MAFEFVFCPPEKTDFSSLVQGDVLERTEVLRAALLPAHAYYAEAPDYTHFMVLTQSCDLVRRNGKIKANYLTLAAVRPFEIVVHRLIKRYQNGDENFPLAICVKDQEVLLTQALERFLHNTENGYFFIRKESHPRISIDLCAFLPLSIALRPAHYDACLGAKVAQLNDIFQAKVGWLTGNQYSRIGTPDLEEFEPNSSEYKDSFYKEVLYKRSAWLTSAQLKRLKSLAKDWTRNHPEIEMDEVIGRELLERVPPHIDLVADRIVDRLIQAKLLDSTDEVRKSAKNLLVNDATLKKLVKFD